MYKTNISNYDGFTRTIEYMKDNGFEEGKDIFEVECKVEHSLNGGVIPELNKEIILRGDNTATVTNEFGEQEGDYDILKRWSAELVPQGTIFVRLVQQCDLSGKINQKCAYKFQE